MTEKNEGASENDDAHEGEAIEKPKLGRGRPKGLRNRVNLTREERKAAREQYGMEELPKGGGQQAVQRLRLELYRGLDLLDQRGKPLHTLIADSLEADTPKALSALARFLPSDVKIEGSVTLVSALDDIGRAIDLELDRRTGDYVVHEDTEDED